MYIWLKLFFYFYDVYKAYIIKMLYMMIIQNGVIWQRLFCFTRSINCMFVSSKIITFCIYVYNLLPTVNLYFAEITVRIVRVLIGKRRMSPVVVVDDVSAVVRTGYVHRIGYRDLGVVCVPKTQHAIFLLRWVRYV